VRHIVALGTVSIANAGTDSPAVSVSTTGLRPVFDTAEMWFISAPAALTGAVTVQVSYVESPTTEWVTLQVNGADVAVAAGKGVVIKAAGFRAFRFHSAATELAQRDFLVAVQVHHS